jgi:hypothetical protein
MSKIGQFNFECQEIAESNFNEKRDVVIAEVEKTFGKRPDMVSYATQVTVEHWEEIQSDMVKFF